MVFKNYPIIIAFILLSGHNVVIFFDLTGVSGLYDLPHSTQKQALNNFTI